MSFFATTGCQDFTIGNEAVEGNAALFAFSPFLQDDGVLALAQILCESDDCILCGDEELLVHNRVHFPVHPDIEPGISCVREPYCQVWACKADSGIDSGPVVRDIVAFRENASGIFNPAV